jgi:peptidyl-prolyl cis-trans isomerase A (cyclophilin A)
MRTLALILLGFAATTCARRTPLLTPLPEELAAPAPDSFLVTLETSRGRVRILAHREWSPLAVDRFHFLVKEGFYDEARLFRVVPGFVVQWGIPADPAVSAVWRGRTLPDEPVRQSNTRGRVSYARGGPNTRGTQLYVNLADNARLDTLNSFGFPPIGEVVEGLAILDSVFASCPRGAQGVCPRQDSIQAQGNAYLARAHPQLDYIRTARITRRWNR